MVCASIDYLFYQNWILLLLAVPITAFYLKRKKKQLIRDRKRNLNYQFKDALSALSVAVQAGYSVENAVSACARDLERIYRKDDDIMKELHYIESQQRVSVPVEELFLDFGERCRVEDIENFASVFYTAKRTGGDLDQVIRKVARMLGDKVDVKKKSKPLWQPKIGADDHESDAGRNHFVSADDFARIFEYFIRKSFWDLCHEHMSWDIHYSILAGKADCRY